MFAYDPNKDDLDEVLISGAVFISPDGKEMRLPSMKFKEMSSYCAALDKLFQGAEND